MPVLRVDGGDTQDKQKDHGCYTYDTLEKHLAHSVLKHPHIPLASLFDG